MREYVVAPADYVYPIPQAFDDVHAAPLLCAGIIGYRSYRMSGIQKGQRLGLYGFGASAHIVLQFARHLGNEVYVFTRGEAHRALALKLGAAWAGGSEDKAPELIDAAIIFAPLGSLVLDALRALRKGGTVALAGIVMSPIPPMDYNLIYHERVRAQRGQQYAAGCARTAGTGRGRSSTHRGPDLRARTSE